MVFGLFSKEKALQKTIERATNKLSQQADRWGALEQLKKDGSAEALVGLCRRFAITSTKAVEDEAEKQWVVAQLIDVGHDALAPVVTYMKSAEQLAFPLKAIERIAPKDEIMKVVDDLLASEPPGYVRHPERRLDLLRWLSEWSAATSADVVPRLVPYLGDFDENVRFATIDGLALHDAALIAEPIIAALLRTDEESGRIRRTLVETIAAKKLPLGGKHAEIGAMLTGPLSSFRIDGDSLRAR